MKAMVFAAGRGTRLRPITDKRPKALAEIEGEPLLAIVLHRLREAGVSEVVINLHHLGEKIEEWVASHPQQDMQISFSREPELLDTGGALRYAAHLLAGDGPFFVHNVDVLSDIDLSAMMQAHVVSGALATLAAKARPTVRPLLFEKAGNLCGRRNDGVDTLVRPSDGVPEPLGFCGIHVVSPELLALLTEEGAFSIVTSYLRLAEAGMAIRLHRVDANRWRDAGRPEDLRPL